MKFHVETLIDITETRARRESDPFAWRQQQNYNTFFGLLSLRVNPVVLDPPIKIEKKLAEQFGSDYYGMHSVWEFDFEVQYKDGLTEKMLLEDFDLVPVINTLEETIILDVSVFRTKDTNLRNIVFSKIDK